jgi:transketolase
MRPLERRIIDISYKNKMSHIGSCITAVGIIDHIYATKRIDDIFVLSNGHAGVALYAVLEKYGLGDADALFAKHGVHPNTDTHIACSSGSLGHGIGIAVGLALAERVRRVYCLLSDGECAEGSVWEALRIASDEKLDNLKVYLNANGYGATGPVNSTELSVRLGTFFPVEAWLTSMMGWPEYLQGIEGHYHVLTKEEYECLTLSS